MKNFKFTWAHGIIAALGLFMAFILYLIFIFPLGKQNSELVTESYYEDELVYQQVIDAKNNADKLPEKPLYVQSAAGIKITMPYGFTSQNTRTNFHLYRTNDALLDIEKEVALDGKNSFEIPAAVLSPGNYTLRLYFTKDSVNYQLDYDVEWK